MKKEFLPPPRTFDLKGFTLAEVLITLAIIGVIAAITIPSIVANHQKTALEAQFAKSYRTLQQAVNLAIAEHGSFDTWDWQDSYTREEKDAFVKKYFTPYLNIVKVCPAGESATTGCLPDISYKYLDNNQTVIDTKNPEAVLADGTTMAFAFKGNCLKNKTRCLAFDVDLNGEKKPNTIGRDVFGFDFYAASNEFLPQGMVITAEKFNEETQSYTKRSYEEVNEACSSGGSGAWHCCAKVVMDGFKINY